MLRVILRKSSINSIKPGRRGYAALSEYDSEHAEIADLSSVADIDGVRRTDSYVPEIMHGYSDEYEGV